MSNRIREGLENQIDDQQRVVDRLAHQLALAQANLEDLKIEMQPVIDMLPKELEPKPKPLEPVIV